jgi:hypothetical protein
MARQRSGQTRPLHSNSAAPLRRAGGVRPESAPLSVCAELTPRGEGALDDRAVVEEFVAAEARGEIGWMTTEEIEAFDRE